MAANLPRTAGTFQRLMRRWEAYAPYNAAQVMHLASPVSPDDAHAAWSRVADVFGPDVLGADVPGAGAEVQTVETSLEAHLTGALNRAFDERSAPLRPFVRPHDGGVDVGLVYRHLVADSASIRLVMRYWLHALIAPEAPLESLELRPMRERSVWRLSTLREVWREVSRMSRAKRVRRLPASHDVRSPVAWTSFDLGDGPDPRALREAARRRGVKVHDLFLASLAMACDGLMPSEHVAARRDLGLGTIVDLRSPRETPERAFGLSLGFLQTFWRPEELKEFDAALAAASRSTTQARTLDQASASVLRLRATLLQHARYDDDAMATFYRKRCPLSAGISNVTLDRSGFAHQHPTPLRAYTRVSPLGPMLPLVLTPTTLGGSMTLGVTWRTGLLDEPRVREIVEAFVARLRLAAGS